MTTYTNLYDIAEHISDTKEVYYKVFVMDGELFVQDDRYEAYPTLDEWTKDNEIPENEPKH